MQYHGGRPRLTAAKSTKEPSMSRTTQPSTTTDRDQAISQAVSTGKIPSSPVALATWRESFDRDPAKASADLAKRKDGVFGRSVVAASPSRASTTGTADTQRPAVSSAEQEQREHEAYMAAVFPGAARAAGYERHRVDFTGATPSITGTVQGRTEA